jgi:uncharacterized protein (TIGR03118 family)
MQKHVQWLSAALLAAGLLGSSLTGCGSSNDNVIITPHPSKTTSHKLTAVQKTNLVSDQGGVAAVTDANLVNSWGIAYQPDGPFWINDNGTGVATIYNGSGQALSSVVTIPPPGGSPAGTTSAPTGIIANGTNNFMVSENGQSGPASFVFDTEDGTISGWNPQVDANSAVLMVDNSTTNAVYKGLAVALNGGQDMLYATDFHNGKIAVFDSTFKAVTLPGSFTDPQVPAGFAPFNIASLNGNLYVTWAKQNGELHDDVAGPGNGYISVFDVNGNLVKSLAQQGPLNSPWGLALAPSGFGNMGGMLLVGNFGDGHITAYDPNSGQMFGQLADSSDNAISIDGLWGLIFGNGTMAGSSTTLFFTSGPNHESDGLFGSLSAM